MKQRLWQVISQVTCQPSAVVAAIRSIRNRMNRLYFLVPVKELLVNNRLRIAPWCCGLLVAWFGQTPCPAQEVFRLGPVPMEEAAFSERIDEIPIVESGLTNSLDELTDQELMELYATTYQESVKGQFFDLSSLAQPGCLLLQVGYTFSTDRDELEFRTVEHTIPEFLIRYRLLERLELRAAWAGVTFDELTDEVSGISDTDTRVINPSLGLRIGLWKQYGYIPRTSLSVSTPYDLDAAGNLTDRLNPLASLGYSWLLSEQTLLSGSSGAVWTRQEESRFIDYRQSVSFACFLSDQLDAHLTWSGLFPEGARLDGLSHTLGPGISLSVTSDVQCDLITSFGLDELSPDFIAQLIVTTRL